MAGIGDDLKQLQAIIDMNHGVPIGARALEREHRVTLIGREDGLPQDGVLEGMQRE